MKEHAQGEARLDRERASTELKRFLDLAVREMGLAIEYEIVNPDSVAGGAGEKDVVVAFHGADQDFLLERDAELLLALEHVAHRLRRLSDGAACRIETLGAGGGATRTRNGRDVSF